VSDTGTVASIPSADLQAGVTAAAASEVDHEHLDRSRVEMVRAYAEHPTCRRAFLLSYFGEAFTPPCGNCDNCDAGHGVPTSTASPYAVGSRIHHPTFGPGTIQHVEADILTIAFDHTGYKTLSASIVLSQHLLADGDD
jgi:ATP-dependent DNA helicase RecQ